MLLLLICLVSHVAAHHLTNQIYEKETTRSLDCKESEKWADMTNVMCAVIAATESIYNFGFVVQEETCMVCRAGGTPRGADVLEISINGPLYVQGGEYSIRRTTLSAHRISRDISYLLQGWFHGFKPKLKDHILPEIWNALSSMYIK